MNATGENALRGDGAVSAPRGAGHGGDVIQRALNAKRSNASENRPHFDAGGRFLHFCQFPGCAAWGAFGVGFRPPETGTWFCGAHLEEGRRMLAERKSGAARPALPAAAPRKQPEQGRLF